LFTDVYLVIYGFKTLGKKKQGLSYCKKLKNLIISSDSGTNLLANLKSCSALEKLNLKSKDEFNIKLSTSNFYGINKFDKLKMVNLDGTTIKF